jgi:hypothetical protein
VSPDRTSAPASMRKLNVLLLCNRPARGADASTVTDHLDAFRHFSRNNVVELSFIRELPSRVALERFDVLAIHYSTALGYYIDHYISAAARQRVRDFPGLKVAFIQDEYRMVDRVHEVLGHLGIDVLFTCVPALEIEKVYPSAKLPGVTKINNLTGYVPEVLLSRSVAPIAERPIDVGYRTRRMPFWLGALGFEKGRIADQFAESARDTGLRLDVSCDEADRLYGEKWCDFVASCKAMLGVESGSSVFDFTDELQKQVDAYVAANPSTTFAEVQAKFLLPHEGKICLNQISPRCFEAAALRTAMVLFEGDYSGVLEPGRHYIPLKKDFSNFADVLSALRDTEGLQRLVERTFEEVARNPAYSYRAFIGDFDAVLDREFVGRGKPAAEHPYDTPALRRDLLRSPAYVWTRFSSDLLQRAILGTRLRRAAFRLWQCLPLSLRHAVRPLLRIIGR